MCACLPFGSFIHRLAKTREGAHQMTELADSPTFMAIETWLATSGRLLLRVAAMLFMAYLLTMAGSLAAAALRVGASARRADTAVQAPRRRPETISASAPSGLTAKVKAT